MNWIKWITIGIGVLFFGTYIYILIGGYCGNGQKCRNEAN